MAEFDYREMDPSSEYRDLRDFVEQNWALAEGWVTWREWRLLPHVVWPMVDIGGRIFEAEAQGDILVLSLTSWQQEYYLQRDSWTLAEAVRLHDCQEPYPEEGPPGIEGMRAVDQLRDDDIYVEAVAAIRIDKLPSVRWKDDYAFKPLDFIRWRAGKDEVLGPMNRRFHAALEKCAETAGETTVSVDTKQNLHGNAIHNANRHETIVLRARALLLDGGENKTADTFKHSDGTPNITGLADYIHEKREQLFPDMEASNWRGLKADTIRKLLGSRKGELVVGK